MVGALVCFSFSAAPGSAGVPKTCDFGGALGAGGALKSVQASATADSTSGAYLAMATPRDAG